LLAYVFSNTDLSDNLFGLAPLINLGYTTTYSRNDTTIDDSTHHTVIYGTKHPLDNVWKFSLPKPNSHSARIVVRHEQDAELVLYASAVRHEQDAELVLYASASFGSPAYRTFYNAVHMGWLTNYPGLTPKAVRRNKPHSLATALGHITASRSNVRSSRLTSDYSPKLALSAQPSAFVEALDYYSENELPDIVLRCTVQHCSAFQRDAIYSDLPGRFPVRAKDGSEYLLLSVYKNYIHVETLPDRPSPHLCAAYAATHTFFRNLGHQLEVQILDNETSESLFTYFDSQHIAYLPVPPNQKRANAAERSIQTFRRHFLSLLATTHPSFPINHWPTLLPQAELTLNLQRPYADLPSISAYNGIYRAPYGFLSHPIAPCGTLIVLHNTRRETWHNFGLIDFYLGPALKHYRSYNCLVSDSDSYRVCDNIILYPAPLVLPGASRFDQLLALTERLTLAAESHTPHDQLSLCVGSLNNVLRDDANTQTTPAVRLQLPTSIQPPAAIPSAAPTIPVTQSTRHRPSSDTGADLIGWTFHERSLGSCKVLHTETYLDSDSILWNTLAYSSSKQRSGPDRLLWTLAEAEEILRLILSGTLLPIS
jgi:hypothetical protein